MKGTALVRIDFDEPQLSLSRLWYTVPPKKGGGRLPHHSVCAWTEGGTYEDTTRRPDRLGDRDPRHGGGCPGPWPQMSRTRRRPARSRPSPALMPNMAWGAHFSSGRAGIATKIRYAFG